MVQPPGEGGMVSGLPRNLLSFKSIWWNKIQRKLGNRVLFLFNRLYGRNIARPAGLSPA
jgi:hypothetical protein